MNSPALVRLLILVFASCSLAAVHAFPIYSRFLVSEFNHVSYGYTGTKIAEYRFQLSYDQHGATLRTVSAYLLSSDVFGYEWREHSTNVISYGQDYSSSSSVTDGITLSNGSAFSFEHAVRTLVLSSNRLTTSTDRTITYADGTRVETITTDISESSTDYRRSTSQVRTVTGELLAWEFQSWTNDPAHSQEFTSFAQGDSDETRPWFVAQRTNTFDSFGNIILTTVYTRFYEHSSVSWTSNSYVLDEKGKILSSTSQTDYGPDGTIDSTTLKKFAYDKKGNPTEETSKVLGPDGSLEGQQVIVFGSDQFGNVIFEDARTFDANGAVVGRYVNNYTYVPRGQSFDRPPKRNPLGPFGPR